MGRKGPKGNQCCLNYTEPSAGHGNWAECALCWALLGTVSWWKWLAVLEGRDLEIRQAERGLQTQQSGLYLFSPPSTQTWLRQKWTGAAVVAYSSVTWSSVNWFNLKRLCVNASWTTISFSECYISVQTPCEFVIKQLTKHNCIPMHFLMSFRCLPLVHFNLNFALSWMKKRAWGQIYNFKTMTLTNTTVRRLLLLVTCYCWISGRSNVFLKELALYKIDGAFYLYC